MTTDAPSTTGYTINEDTTPTGTHDSEVLGDAPMASVLFVCVRNSGKSQMAAGLMRRLVGDRLRVASAGTQAGRQLNALSVQALAEVGVDITDQHPTQITDELQRTADLVVTVGGDAEVPELPGRQYQRWDIDEPSTRGIEGVERMRLVRDDIDQQVRRLADELLPLAEAHPSRQSRAGGRSRITDYDRLVDELAYTYDGTFSHASIAAAVAAARAHLEPIARFPDFLPILVSRFAREQLTAAAQATGQLPKPVPELLFVCVQNAGRSQMAAALAQHLSAGKVHVRSAGSQPTDQINPVAVAVLAERGISLVEAYPKPLTNDVVHAADVIVTMGCGDACPIYPGKRYLDWDVADPNGRSIDVVRDIRDDLQARVSALLRDLNI